MLYLSYSYWHWQQYNNSTGVNFALHAELYVPYVQVKSTEYKCMHGMLMHM